MKYLFLLFLSAQAFAGGRTIYCEGQNVRTEMRAKGPTPMDSDATIQIYNENIEFIQVNRVDDEDSYDFQITYESSNIDKDLHAVLDYSDSKHALTVFKNNELIEKVECTLGF